VSPEGFLREKICFLWALLTALGSISLGPAYQKIKFLISQP
jgi:hypothetical protein